MKVRLGGSATALALIILSTQCMANDKNGKSYEEKHPDCRPRAIQEVSTQDYGKRRNVLHIYYNGPGCKRKVARFFASDSSANNCYHPYAGDNSRFGKFPDCLTK